MKVLELFQTYVGRFGMISVVLVLLENIVDDNFFCPCEPRYNKAMCGLYAIVPAIACFVGTYWFFDLRENNAMVDINIFRRSCFPTLVAFTWFSLFFLDGRYLACGLSDWQSSNTKFDNSMIMQWCKPTGNKTSVLYSQQRTLELMAISQYTGFGIMMAIIVGLIALKLTNNLQRNPEEPQQPTAEQLPMTGNEDDSRISTSVEN